MTRDVPHSPERLVHANGIDIAYDTFGDPHAPPMLILTGLGVQMIFWDDAFCSQLAARGYWVIRCDNRDSGRATVFDQAGVPDIPALRASLARREPLDVPYTLSDMAADGVGLLDALGIASAHVFGHSMGGMIAQTLVIEHPERVRTLVSLGSSPYPPQMPDMPSFAPPADREGWVEARVANERLANGGVLPFDKARERRRAERCFDRGTYPEGTVRQLAAVIASGDRTEALRAVRVPTLVVHGRVDPFVPVECGIATAEAIPGSKLLILEQMGHRLAPAVWADVIDAIAAHATP
jgi:pimeloyl-ACP methyl ester carboxylesterase